MNKNQVENLKLQKTLKTTHQKTSTCDKNQFHTKRELINSEIIVRNSDEFRFKNKKNNKDTEGRMRG